VSPALYLILAAGILIAYLLITEPTPAERRRDRTKQLRRVVAEMDRERQRITQSTRQQIDLVRREAERHQKGS
jgi:hypothetical protein